MDAVLRRIHQAFDGLVYKDALRRPVWGQVTVEFRDGKLFLVTVSQQYNTETLPRQPKEPTNGRTPDPV